MSQPALNDTSLPIIPRLGRILWLSLVFGNIFWLTSVQAKELSEVDLRQRVQDERADSSLTLNDVVRLVLKQNPELKASTFRVRAADASYMYAGQFKNPELIIELEDFLGSGRRSNFSSAETTLSLRQTLELGGQRGARTAVADAALTAAKASYESRRVQVVGETVVRFLHVVADQHRLELATRAGDLATQGLDFATRRVKSGAASMVEQRRAGIVVARSKITAEHAEHELRASKRRLSMMWGESEVSFATAEANLFAPRELPTYDDLAARIDENPELIRFVKEQAVQSARLALAEAQATPDLSLSLGGRRTEGPEAYSMVFGVSAPIAFFQRNQGAIGAAKSKQSELAAQREAERGRLLASLYGHAQELAHAKEQLEILHQEILPDAEAVLKLVTSGFKSGRFSQIELLEAQRTLVELEHERIGTAEKMWTLAVSINSILGTARQVSESLSSEPEMGDSLPTQGDNDE